MTQGEVPLRAIQPCPQPAEICPCAGERSTSGSGVHGFRVPHDPHEAVSGLVSAGRVHLLAVRGITAGRACAAPAFWEHQMVTNLTVVRPVGTECFKAVDHNCANF